jgi:hypothetical protein
MTQRLIPSGPFINETGTSQAQVPGGPFINDTFASGALTMPAGTGSFALTGQDAVFSDSGEDPVLVAASGPFVLGGIAAGLVRGYRITAEKGTFELAGAPSLSDHEVDVETGTFSLTGNDASFRFGHVLTSAKGTFALTVNDVVLVASPLNKAIQAETGTFVLTGNDTTITLGSKTLPADSGEFTVSGGEIHADYSFSAESGSFTLTVNASTLTFAGRTVWNRVSNPSTTWTRVN